MWTSQYPVSTLLDPESAPVGHGGGDPGQLPGPGRRHRVERDPLDLDSDRRGAASLVGTTVNGAEPSQAHPSAAPPCGVVTQRGGGCAGARGVLEEKAPGGKRTLDKNYCQGHAGGMQDVEVIESTEAAAAALDPVRARLLGELAEPASAAGLAARVGITRQKVNYHLKTLEAHGLVELSEERRHGGITERVLQASATAYVVSPAAVSAAAADPDATDDHLSAGYLVALAGRLVREVGALARRAGASGKRLPTLTIDTEIGFRSAADRAAFADDLTAAVLDLAARYHHDDGRPHRLVVAAHPVPEEQP